MEFNSEDEDKVVIDMVCKIVESKKNYLVRSLLSFIYKPKESIIYALFVEEFKKMFSLENIMNAKRISL